MKALDTWEALQKAKKRDRYGEKKATQILQDQRNMEMEAELPHPQCCLSARYVFPYQDLDRRTNVARNGGKPEWRVTFNTQWHGGYAGTFGVTLPIAFCPFCGTSLPDLRRKLRPPPHLRVENAVDRCAQCCDSDCDCSYPESAWEITEGTT